MITKSSLYKNKKTGEIWSAYLLPATSPDQEDVIGLVQRHCDVGNVKNFDFRYVTKEVFATDFENVEE